MKILIITPTFPPQKCGVGDYTKIISLYLTKLEQEVEIVTIGGVKEFYEKNARNPKVSFVIDKWNWSALKTIKRLIKDGRPDVVNIQYSIANYSNYHPMISFLPVFIKFWRLNCKTIATIHEITPPKLSPAIPDFANRCFGLFCTTILLIFTDKVIVCSNWVFGEIRKKLAFFGKHLRNKVYFVPVGSNIALEPLDKLAQTKLLCRYKITEKDFIVCFFGFIREGRDLDTLIKTYKSLLEECYDIKLLLLGGILDKQYTEKLRALSEKLRIDDKIIWTEMLSSKEVSLLLRSVDICVSINTSRGISLNSGSFHAAAIHGLPIITNRGKHVPQGLIDGENVIFVEPRSENNLKDSILRLYNSDELRKNIGQNMRKYSESFTWEDIAEKINIILKSSCGQA